MARSLKKGPYIHYKLQRKIDAMNETGKNSVIKTWSRASMTLLILLVKQFVVHNGRDNSFLFLLQKTWLVIN